jgi:plastocyanin
LTGRRAQATVSFGQWDANNFDRFPVNSDRTRNIHELLPFEVEIDAGGAVSFIISGVHQILIYQDGTTLEDLQARVARDGAILPIGPGLVDHAFGRLYRGLNPFALFYQALPPVPPATTPVPLMVQDRVESVNFPNGGRFLVVCGVLPHFNEGMHGFVRVREHD